MHEKGYDAKYDGVIIHPYSNGVTSYEDSLVRAKGHCPSDGTGLRTAAMPLNYRLRLSYPQDNVYSFHRKRDRNMVAVIGRSDGYEYFE